MKNEEINMSEAMINHLRDIANNPGNVIDFAYTILENATEGKINVPDPSNPFSYVLEMSALQAAAIRDAHETHYRYQYPKLASKYEHLYNHMFDEHYIGRFAVPGKAKFHFHLRKDEVVKTLVDVEEIKGMKKIIIPRGSYITFQDFVFTLLYDIEIRQLSHGGIHVLYHIEKHDPVQLMSTNIVDWDYVIINGVEYIRIKPTIPNVKITSYREHTIQMAGFSQVYELNGHYVHCRVYHVTDGRVEEISTTHSDLIYDQTKVTAKLTYLERKLKVEIPQIYYNNNKLGQQIFIEIYTTEGDVEISLSEYSYDNFNYQWGRLDNPTADIRYVTPIEELSTTVITAEGMLKGGSLGESFEETRDRVINFANYSLTPITPNQLETTMKIDGYDILKSRDTLTGRTYYASRSLPISKYDNFATPIASSVEMLKVNLETLTEFKGVKDNGKRLTITPSTLFKLVDNDNKTTSLSKIVPVGVNDIPDIERMGADRFLTEVNKLNYMYTPFYYVLDTTDNDFEMRPYYFDKPYISNQMFILNNQTSKLSVSSDLLAILPHKDDEWEGFILRVKTRAIKEYTEQDPSKLFCQLAIIPVGDTEYAYLNGELIGAKTDEETELKDYVWEFKLKTNWDVSRQHGLVIDGLRMRHDDRPRKYELPLESDVYFIYGMIDTHVPDYEPTVIDKLINRNLLGNDDFIIGISYDKASYHLGDYLERLWSNAITVQGSVEYERYEKDIPRVYSRDVYDISPEGDLVIENDDLVILHHAGDPILDERGQPVYFARKGDVKIDKKGNPVLKNGRQIQRLIELTMLDGVYYFATDANDVEYRQLVTDTLKDYIINDLQDIGSRLLENTQIYFYAKRTMGQAKTIVDDGIEIAQQMRQSFSIVYYLSDAAYGNLDIREALDSLTQRVISQELNNVNISTSSIVTKLKEAAGQDVVAIDVVKLGSSKYYTTISMKDPTSRCSIKRILVAKPDKTLKVEEDIVIGFMKHDAKVVE